MRVIKDNTARFESFSKSLQYYTKGNSSGDFQLINIETHRSRNNLFEKYNYIVQSLYTFQKKFAGLKNIDDIHFLFSHHVKMIISSKEVDLFLFDDSRTILKSVSSKSSALQNNLVNKAFKNGILDWIFETQKPTLIPDLSSITGEGSKLYQTIFPVYYQKNPVGVVSLLGPAYKISEDSLENQAIYILLSAVIPQIISIQQKNKINKLYDDLQTYESKLNNDFKLYAVGEFAEGIIHDMLNSLQVILSNVDYIESLNTGVDTEIFEKIRERVERLSGLSQKLFKFNEINQNGGKQNLPCDLNNLVKEFYGVVTATLKSLELECELDLEDNIPPVLGNSKEIKQILTNIFSMIKKKSNRGSGIVIQTKYINEVIVLSVFVTDYWEDFGESSDYISNLTIKIVGELMKKCDGKIEYDSMPLKGTSIHLLFPLKRKLTK
ncbi:sensor histidine kinase [Melioribacter roseus P3M-2]|uniref:histidine kinase n=1 Tax=Melioribacter roseus (strain DSM 23840 / JCM 17771 / VKM B-2668 / P3M-2) TaxID=1191523 RepID=I7A2E8_MELRP|nr:HAMP domain-containing histidine kinase [Melioribacter roseus]AFN75383.1 sensor histidine kinase [Melioribacter roseus P3M-2]